MTVRTLPRDPRWLGAGGVVYTAGVPWFVLDVAYTEYGIGSVFHLVPALPTLTLTHTS